MSLLAHPLRTRWCWAVPAVAVLVSACDEPLTEQRDGLSFAARSEAPARPQFSGVLDGEMELAAPMRITAHGGRLLVSDKQRRAVFSLDPRTLEVDGGFAVDGVPQGVAMWGGRIYVGNTTARRVDVFSVTGGYLTSFGDGLYPTDLAVDHRLGLLFVLDSGDPSVKVYAVDGELVRVIGQGGFLRSPFGIALDADRREVLVSDYGTAAFRAEAAIRIFEYEGDLVQEISGRLPGFSRPQGLAVDDAGLIYLVDVLLAEVIVLNRTSGVVARFGSHVRDGGTLRFPLDIVLGRDGTAYVTSFRTGSVALFGPEDVNP